MLHLSYRLDMGRLATSGMRMDFKSSLILLAAVFVLGCLVGYSARALISRKHRRRFERTGGYPMAE